MANVLVIDDDSETGEMLVELVTAVEHQAQHVTTLRQGLKLAATGNFDVVFLDVRMPDGCGLDIISTILAVQFPPEIIVITGQGDSVDAETAIKKGAWDYIQKPLSPKQIIQPLNQILIYRDGLRSVSKPGAGLHREEIVGNSPAVKQCLSKVAKAGYSQTNVLVTGETGTGKELFARAVHNNSKRCKANFIVIDCAALPETLAESVLFGHEKGAFTGADRPAKGLVSLADGGTLFLDEVGELSSGLQKVFLRVLQEKTFRPVGGKKEISSDFRLIAATNRNPESMVKEGNFREDLLYRLNGINIHLPPLRDRGEDINELTVKYINRACESLKCPAKELSPEFISTLQNYDWPGNVRQLINIVEYTVSEALYEPVLFPKHLPSTIRVKAVTSSIKSSPSAVETIESQAIGAFSHKQNLRPDLIGVPLDLNEELPSFKEYRRSIMQQVEHDYLQRLMQITHGNIKKACQLSGLGRTRLYNLLKEHNVDRMGWE